MGNTRTSVTTATRHAPIKPCSTGATQESIWKSQRRRQPKENAPRAQSGRLLLQMWVRSTLPASATRNHRVVLASLLGLMRPRPRPAKPANGRALRAAPATTKMPSRMKMLFASRSLRAVSTSMLSARCRLTRHGPARRAKTASISSRTPILIPAALRSRGAVQDNLQSRERFRAVRFVHQQLSRTQATTQKLVAMCKPRAAADSMPQKLGTVPARLNAHLAYQIHTRIMPRLRSSAFCKIHAAKAKSWLALRHRRQVRATRARMESTNLR